MRRAVFDALALEHDRAFGDARVVEAEKARDRPQRRGLAGAVGAEQRDDLPGLDRKRDALHRRDGAVIDHFELLDVEERRSSARSRGRAVPERPQQEVTLHAPPDADEPERLEHQEQDHDQPESGVIHRKQQAGIALRARQREQADFDDIGKEGDEDRPEQRAEQRAHAADDHHREILDGEEERERLDGNEAAVIGEQRAGDRGDAAS